MIKVIFSFLKGLSSLYMSFTDQILIVFISGDDDITEIFLLISIIVDFYNKQENIFGGNPEQPKTLYYLVGSNTKKCICICLLFMLAVKTMKSYLQPILNFIYQTK